MAVLIGAGTAGLALAMWYRYPASVRMLAVVLATAVAVGVMFVLMPYLFWVCMIHVWPDNLGAVSLEVRMGIWAAVSVFWIAEGCNIVGIKKVESRGARHEKDVSC